MDYSLSNDRLTVRNSFASQRFKRVGFISLHLILKLMSVVVLAFGAVNIIGKRKAAVMPSSDTSHINSMASFCVNCGAHMEPGVAFCHNCGAKNTTDTSAPYSSETAYSSEYPYEDNTSYVTNPYYHDESYESAPMNGTAPTDESKPTSRLRITFKTKG